MPRPDQEEQQLLGDYEAGRLVSVASAAELERLREAARATAVKDKRVNIRLSSGDLMDTDVYGCQQHVPPTVILVPSAA